VFCKGGESHEIGEECRDGAPAGAEGLVIRSRRLDPIPARGAISEGIEEVDAT